MSLTMKSKLVLAFCMAIILSIIGVLLVVFLEVNEYSKESFESTSVGQLQRIDEFINEVVVAGMNNIKFLASLEDSRNAIGHLSKFHGPNALTGIDPDRMSPQEHKIYKVFEHMAEEHTAYGAFFLGSNEGGFVVYPPDPALKGYDPRKRGWYKLTMGSSKETELTHAFMCNNGLAVVCGMTRVKDATGNTIGILGLNINLSTLTDLTSGLKMGRTGYILLLEKDGIILSDPRHTKFNFKKAQETNIDALKKLATMSRGSFEAEIDGKDKLITVITSKATGWKLAYIIDSEEVFENSNAMLTKALLIGACIGVVLLIGAWLLALTLVRPLTLLTSSAETVAGGDFHALPDAKHFSGEFLTLYTSFKKMVGELVNSLGMAEEKARDAEEKTRQAEQAMHEAENARGLAEKAQSGMLEVAQALEKIVDQVTSASQELSAQIEDASSGSATQRDRTAETSSAMDQMNSSVLEVANNASKAAESADKAWKEAENGEDIVKNVVASIDQVNNKTQAMSASLDSLGQQAEGIGQIMTVITDIADQTNLLALNAAIEAARAGDAGRGFAVVADEVRKLAEKTMSATKEVGDSVTAIQQGAAGAITDMGEAAQLVSKTTEFAKEAGEALHGILGIVEATADQVRAIATSSEEQSAASEEINRHTDEVTQIAVRTDASMEEATQAVHDLTRLTEEMLELIAKLKQE